MNKFVTSDGLTAPASAEAVSLPRRHVAAIAALVCIPIPLLSLGATLVPLPQLLERAAASFVSIAVTSSGEDRLIRERTAPGALEIVYRPDEPVLVYQGLAPSPGDTSNGNASELRKRSAWTAKPKKETRRKGSAPVRSQPLETGEPETGVSVSDQPSGSTQTESETGSHGSQASAGSPAEPPTSKPAGGQSGGGGTQGGGSSGTGGGSSSGGGKSGGSSGGGSSSGGDGGKSGGSGTGGSGSSGGGSSTPEPPKADPGSGGNGGGNGGGSAPTTPPRNDSAQAPGGKGRP